MSTPPEGDAYRYAQVDALAAAWDEQQVRLGQALRDAANNGRCECCDELRIWMSKLYRVGVSVSSYQVPDPWGAPIKDGPSESAAHRATRG